MDSQSNLFATIVASAENNAYTDIYVRPGELTRIKTPLGWQGLKELTGYGASEPSPEALQGLIGTLSGRPNWVNELKDVESSFAFMLPLDEKGTRLRFKVARCAPRGGTLESDAIAYTIHIRKFAAQVPALDATGLPGIVKDFLPQSGGLILVTGTVCCGKTTTLASMVDYLNRASPLNITTLERLIEYLHNSERSIVTQRTVPLEVPSFLRGIQDALDGQAVDVLMIGEVVDKSTMDAMLKAAESGLLVLATMHAKNAVGAITRIADMFSGEELQMRLSMLSDKLNGVIAQKLVPTKDGKEYALAYEILNGTANPVKEAIKNNKMLNLQGCIEEGSDDGMITLNRHLKKLVEEGKIDQKVALQISYDSNELRELLN